MKTKLFALLLSVFSSVAIAQTPTMTVQQLLAQESIQVKLIKVSDDIILAARAEDHARTGGLIYKDANKICKSFGYDFSPSFGIDVVDTSESRSGLSLQNARVAETVLAPGDWTFKNLLCYKN